MVSFLLQLLIVIMVFFSGFYAGVVGASKGDLEGQNSSLFVSGFFAVLAVILLLAKAFS